MVEQATAVGQHPEKEHTESESRYLHRRMDTIAHDVQSLRTGVAEASAKMDRVLHALNGTHPLGEGALIHTVQMLKAKVEALDATCIAIQAEKKAREEAEANSARNAKWSFAVSLAISLIALLITTLRSH